MPADRLLRIGTVGIGYLPVARERRALASQHRCDILSVASLLRWSRRRKRGSPILESALQRIVDSSDPCFDIFLGRRLVDSSELRCDDFKAESSVRVACLANRRHAQIYRIHVQIELVFPVDVFRQPALIEDDPELMPGLLVQTLRINVTARPTQSPQQPFFALSEIRVADVAVIKITEAFEPVARACVDRRRRASRRRKYTTLLRLHHDACRRR